VGLFSRCLALAWLTLMPSLAAAQWNENEVLNFAAGWRIEGERPQNVLQLGTVYSCTTGWCVEVEEYPGGMNLPRRRLDNRHEMRLHTGAEGCIDEYLTTVKGVRSVESGAHLRQTDTGYVLETESRRYSWASEPGNPTAFLLREVSSIGQSVALYPQTVGFAYWSEEAKNAHYVRSQYNAYFDGQIAHKNTLMGVLDDWQESQTSLDFRKFSAATGSSPVLSFEQAGHPEVLKRMKKLVDAHHSVLPPTDVTTDRLRFFNHEYGHDFNANGCFDEFGHNKIMLPILKDSDIAAFVFVEYTHDKLDGIPMLSVGRYFRKYSIDGKKH